MQARYYDPVIGRFYSNDPVGYTDANPVMSFNRYMYANNSPYKYKDPDGEFIQFAIGAAVGFASEVITQIASGGSVSDWGEVAMQTGIGAISGGTGGAGARNPSDPAAGLSSLPAKDPAVNGGAARGSSNISNSNNCPATASNW
ncbi:RHS repeat-associated core domain-containing protein [Pseudidiomarina fusca]|nr:RHS repeat-associated core domain-containing protein [Pseudidiomarina sp. GXY010]